MSLKERLSQDLVEAMKAKDALRLSVLRMVKAALQKKQQDKLADLVDQRKQELAQQPGRIPGDRPELNAEEVRALQQQAEIDDAEVLQTLSNLIKQHRDSVEQFTRGNRPDLAEKEQAEIKILQSYLPESLSPAAIEEIVEATIREVGATSQKDIGLVMKTLMPKFSGKGVDGKLVNTLVRQRLK